MNMNRLRPVGVQRKDLDTWLSSVVCDAVRDAVDAGLSRREAYEILKTITQTEHPMGYEAGKREFTR